jgi:hypothetical protein
MLAAENLQLSTGHLPVNAISWLVMMRGDGR